MTIAALKALCSRIRWCEPAVLESVLELVLEIAREGREGRRIGALFPVGKADEVLAASRALILDPLAGHALAATHIGDPDVRGTIQEAACRYLDASVEQIDLPLGFGSRHLAAASISQRVGMSKHWSIAVLAFVLTIGGAVFAGAQPSQTTSDTYTWNGEFVSLDTTAKTMTEKSRVAYQEAISQLKHFKAGDRVWVWWSGVHDSSAAVRQVRRPRTGRKIDENLMLPAELVSTEAPNQYITIRVKVPERAMSAIKTVKPGEWVTVTFRHRPSTDDEPVVAIRPYGARTTTE